MKASEFKALIKEEVKKALVKESAMSDLDLMAKDAISFNAFAVEFFKEYPNIKQDEKMGFIKWLKTVYMDAKKNK